MKTAHAVAFLLGVACTLLAVQTFRPIEARAQSKKKYYVYAIDENNRLGPGYDGAVSLSATGLMSALQHAGANGYRVVSVYSPADVGGHVVVVEK